MVLEDNLEEMNMNPTWYKDQGAQPRGPSVSSGLHTPHTTRRAGAAGKRMAVACAK